MPAEEFRDRRRAAPLGFLGMLALVMLVEAGISRFEPDLRPPIQNQWRLQARASVEEAVGADILCLGDSLVAQGVIPAVLEDRLGRTAYNLGMGGGQFPAHDLFFRRLLDRGARPSALVIDVLPEHLKTPTSRKIHLWAEIFDFRDALEAAWTARDPDFLGQYILAWLVPSIRTRLEIRQAILAGLGGTSLGHRATNLAGDRNLKRNRGALILPPYHFFQVDPRHQRWVYPKAIEPERWNLAMFERLLERAGSLGIPVFWVLTPVCPTIQATAEQTGTAETHARFVREVQRRHPGVIVVDARRAGYPQHAFDDSIHLAYPAAAIFSADLADVIGPTLDAGRSTPSRWVALAPYRERSIEFRHEDLAESRKAVAEPTARR